MKKLLAAVTSIAMSASFITSAFASSIIVSAAGGSPAVQPNVSMEEVIDGAANKNVQEDFIVTGDKVTAKPGETVEVNFRVNSGGHKGATLCLDQSALPAGITTNMGDFSNGTAWDPTNYAVGNEPGWTKLGDTLYCEMRDGAENPQKFTDDEIVIWAEYTLPADIKPGDYEINFDRFHVVEQGSEKHPPIIEFNAKVIPAVITVEGETPTPTDPTPTPTDPTPTPTDPTPTPTDPTPTPTDPTPTKDPSTVKDDFVVTGDKVTAKPGETVEVNFHVNSGGHKGATLCIDQSALPAGIKTNMGDFSSGTTWDPTNYAVGNEPGWTKLGDTLYCEMRDGAENPQKFTDDEIVIWAEYTLPADIKPGEYKIDFDRFHVVEQGSEKHPPIIEFDAKVIPAVITVEGETPTPTDPTPTDPTPTKDPSTVKDDFVVTGDKVTAKPGETVEVNFHVNSGGHKGATLCIDQSALPAGIKTNMGDFSSGTTWDPTNYAVGNEPGWTKLGDTLYCEMRDGAENPQKFTDDEIVIWAEYTLPADIKPGDYEIDFDRFHVVEQGSEKHPPIIEFDAKVIPAVITVEGETPTPTDPTPTDPKPTTPTPTEPTPTNPPAKEGEAVWVIDTVHGKAGQPVDVPVFVKGNSTLEVSGATYTITADAGFNKVSGNCAAYGNAAIVNNADTSEYAFAQGIGNGNAAADKAVIMTITYDVPADAKGTIPVEWANVTVSDEFGNLITEKVKLENGAIIIDEESTNPPAAEGEAVWVIDTVHGKAGQPVDVPVFVKGNSTLEVSGATYTITADAGFNKVSGNCAAYGNAAIVNNADTSEYAFAQGIGNGNAAADKAVIMTITYDVPADAKGTIPVEWANVTVSDEFGNLITEKVKLENGAIIIDEESTNPPAAEGEAVWVIDTVHGKAGQPVDVPVFVKGNSTLEVSGATYTITADAGFNKVSGNCAAYGNAAIVNNADTSEYAFAQGIGNGNAAADKAVIMTITYDVPADAKGTIPVEWANVTVSDEFGNLITEKVKLENGAIIIDEESTNPPAAEGEAVWVIDTVHGKAGQPVDVPVFVKGNSTLEVSGATYTITADAGFNKVSGNCAAYGNAAIVNNADTSEYAFAQGIGNGNAAADKAVIMTITYDVPADAKGIIPVEWANVTVSDEFGNLITEKVKLENGAIIIDETPTDATTEASTAPKTTDSATEPKTTDSATEPKTTESATEPKTTESATEPKTTESATEPKTTESATTPKTTDSATEPKTTESTPVPTDPTPTTPTPTDPTPTTPTPTNPPAAEGEAVWVIDTVHGKAGQSVDVPVFVKGDSTLEVAGAIYTITADAKFNKVSGNCAAYGNAAIVNNADTSEYAFAQGIGNGNAAADKAVIMTITYDVPADAKGIIPVEWANVTVSDEFGNLITEKVKLENGAIIIDETPTDATTEASTAPKTTDSATEPKTTESATEPKTTDSATEPKTTDSATEPKTTESATEPKTTDSATEPKTTDSATEPKTTDSATEPKTTDSATEPKTTESATAPTTTAPVTTEPIVTPAPGAVIWQGETVTAAPGEEVKLSFIVNDPNGSSLAIGGAIFTIDAEGNVTLVDGEGSEAYSAVLQKNPDTGEFAFAHEIGEGIVGPNGEKVITLTFKVPEDAKDGDAYKIGMSGLTVSDTNGLDITDRVLVLDGVIQIKVPATTEETTENTVPTVTTNTNDSGTQPTTTTTRTGSQLGEGQTTSTKEFPNVDGDVAVAVKVVEGYFFSHDPRPFTGEMVVATQILDEDRNLVEFDPAKVTYEDTVNKGGTPMAAYRLSQTDFTYKLNVFYDGVPLYYENGERVVVTAYIGVKGDGDLDNRSDSYDASLALIWYGKKQTGVSDDVIRLAPENCDIVNQHPELDGLAAFLIDVDKDCYSKDNWKTPKTERTIDANDASWILAYYGKVMTGTTDLDEAWDIALASQGRGENFDNYVANGTLIQAE